MRQGVVLQIVRYSKIQWKKNIKLLQSERVNFTKDAMFHAVNNWKDCSGHNKLDDKWNSSCLDELIMKENEWKQSW